MKNTFTYFPHEKIYHIHLGNEGQLGHTIVDQEGFDVACSLHATWTRNNSGYAYANRNNIPVALHRLITGEHVYLDVDHINSIKLDNRKCNLRLITRSYNIARRKCDPSKNISGYKGVALHRKNGRWRAEITINGKCKSLGYYLTKEEAALIYNKAAKEAFGDCAYQNEIFIK